METKETNIEFLTSLTTLIWNLSENDIETTIEKTTILYDDNLDYSFKTVLCQILYESIKFQKKEVGIYFTYLKSIEKISEKTKNIFDFFGNFLSHQFSNLSIFLREIMIEQKLIDTKYISRDKRNTYYKFFKSVKKHSKYTNEFHRQLIKEGHNPNEIAKIIRNDEIEKLQEISSQSNFDYNQTIKPSLYERCSFINKNNVTLIDYAAFFSSIKCFKYLLMNGAKLDKTGKYAVAGGNEEIIHLCEQNHSSFLRAYETAIEYHRNDLFKYLYENKITKINHLKKLGKRCVSHHNYEILAFLQKEGLEINDYIINKAAEMGNIFLVKHFLINNPLPKDILFLASGSTNIELVKYILDTYQNEIDINYQYICLLFYMFILIF